MAFIRKKDRTTLPSEGFEDFSTPSEILELARSKGVSVDPINIAELAMLLGMKVRYEPMGDDDSGSLKKR